MNHYENKTIAGIIAYNPDITRLKENLEKVYPQVWSVVIVDNASINSQEIDELANRIGSRACVLHNDRNYGVASALNQIFGYGKSHDVEWVLTLDQDSIVNDRLIAVYKEKLSGYASLTCLRHDRNITTEQKATAETYQIETVERCITSGNMVRVSAWEEVGGFDEKLFIDMVDVDFCLRLNQHGLKIGRLSYYGLLHELGDGSQLTIFGKKHFTGNYSAFRKYYIFRNMTYVIRKYKLKNDYYSFKRLAMLFAAIWLIEDDKIHKAASSLRGLIDGIRMPIDDIVYTRKSVGGYNP